MLICLFLLLFALFSFLYFRVIGITIFRSMCARHSAIGKCDWTFSLIEKICNQCCGLCGRESKVELIQIDKGRQVSTDLGTDEELFPIGKGTQPDSNCYTLGFKNFTTPLLIFLSFKFWNLTWILFREQHFNLRCSKLCLVAIFFSLECQEDAW